MATLVTLPDCVSDEEDTKDVEFGMGTLPGADGVECINDMKVCMYDESHIVAGGKYHAHVEECRKQYQGASFKENVKLLFCPYNLTHHIQPKYMDMHIMLCDGYYKHNMNLQEDPLSMQVVYERYKTVNIPAKKADSEDPELLDDRDEWGNDDDYLPIQGITIEDQDGIVQTPQTRGEFRAIQEALALKLAKEAVKDVPLPSRKLVHSLGLEDDFLVELEVLLPSITQNEKMRNVAKYAKESAKFAETYNAPFKFPSNV